MPNLPIPALLRRALAPTLAGGGSVGLCHTAYLATFLANFCGRIFRNIRWRKCKEKGRGYYPPALLLASLHPRSGADHPGRLEIDRLHAVGVEGEVRVFVDERPRPIGATRHEPVEKRVAYELAPLDVTVGIRMAKPGGPGV